MERHGTGKVIPCKQFALPKLHRSAMKLKNSASRPFLLFYPRTFDKLQWANAVACNVNNTGIITALNAPQPTSTGSTFGARESNANSYQVEKSQILCHLTRTIVHERVV